MNRSGSGILISLAEAAGFSLLILLSLSIGGLA